MTLCSASSGACCSAVLLCAVRASVYASCSLASKASCSIVKWAAELLQCRLTRQPLTVQLCANGGIAFAQSKLPVISWKSRAAVNQSAAGQCLNITPLSLTLYQTLGVSGVALSAYVYGPYSISPGKSASGLAIHQDTCTPAVADCCACERQRECHLLACAQVSAGNPGCAQQLCIE